MKKVSIIIPVFNMEDSLKHCLESIQHQTYSNLEVILIDDGSKDNSFEICKKYSKEIDFVKTWSIPNSGAGPARNYGIEKATGEFVYFMDADDTLKPTAVSNLLEGALVYDCDLVVFGYKRVDEKGKLCSQKNYEKNTFKGKFVRENYDLFFDMNFKFGVQGPPWNKFFDLTKIKRNKITFPSMKRHQDEVFISRYVDVTEKILFFDEVLYEHRINNVTSKAQKFSIDYINVVKELYLHRVNVMFKWKPNNQRLQGLAYIEYVYNTIKAFDTLFNPKLNMSKQKKISWIKYEAQKITVDKNLINLANYKSKVKLWQIFKFVEYVEKEKYNKIYYMIKFRVLLEKKFGLLIFLLKRKMIKINNSS